jgi:hypothetical protein
MKYIKESRKSQNKQLIFFKTILMIKNKLNDNILKYINNIEGSGIYIEEIFAESNDGTYITDMFEEMVEEVERDIDNQNIMEYMYNGSIVFRISIYLNSINFNTKDIDEYSDNYVETLLKRIEVYIKRMEVYKNFLLKFKNIFKIEVYEDSDNVDDVSNNINLFLRYDLNEYFNNTVNMLKKINQNEIY